jgi:hypothetical protein
MAAAIIVGMQERHVLTSQVMVDESSVVAPDMSDASDANPSETVVLKAGDLMQSIPPDWTFISQQTFTAPALPGAGPKMEHTLRSSGTDTVVTMREYAIMDHAALKGFIQAQSARWSVEGREVVPLDLGEGRIGILMSGTYQAVLLAPGGDDRMWTAATVDDLPAAVRGLIRAIRLL